MKLGFTWLDLQGNRPALKDHPFLQDSKRCSLHAHFIRNTPVAGMLVPRDGIDHIIKWATVGDASGVAKFIHDGQANAIAMLLAGPKSQFDLRTVLMADSFFRHALPEEAIVRAVSTDHRPLAVVVLRELSLYGARTLATEIVSFCSAYFATEQTPQKLLKTICGSFEMSADSLLDQLGLSEEEKYFAARNSEELGAALLTKFQEATKARELRPLTISATAALVLMGAQAAQRLREADH